MRGLAYQPVDVCSFGLSEKSKKGQGSDAAHRCHRIKSTLAGFL